MTKGQIIGLFISGPVTRSNCSKILLFLPNSLILVTLGESLGENKSVGDSGCMNNKDNEALNCARNAYTKC